MIIFVSDLHVFDGTAGPANIPVGAYKGAFKDIGQMVQDAHATNVKIVFMGDIFDLIRTAAWQDSDVSEDEKPWGANPSVRKPLEIMNQVVKHECFDVLGGDLSKFGFPASTERVYIPGNHDRLLNLYPELAAIAVSKLGLKSGGPFPHYFADKEHGCFARHGHEFDYYNFGGSKTFSSNTWVEIPEADYARTPIGDVIAAEFASALPGAVMKALVAAGRPPDPALETRLRNMFDLRPMGAIPAFLAYEVEHAADPVVQDAIMDGIHERVHALRSLPFVREWFAERDKWYNPFDKADQLQILMKVLDYLEFGFIKRALPVADHYSHLLPPDDNFASDAALEFVRLSSPSSPFKASGMQYVLYGHTHKPEQTLIDVVGGCPRMYLNTGMWRPKQHGGLRSGFTGLKHLTFTIIYAPGERLNKQGTTKAFPTFEVWTGALKDE